MNLLNEFIRRLAVTFLVALFAAFSLGKRHDLRCVCQSKQEARRNIRMLATNERILVFDTETERSIDSIRQPM